MKHEIDTLTKDSRLRSFIRSAYHDLCCLRDLEYAQVNLVAGRPYIIKQFGKPNRPDENWLRPINTELFIDDPDLYLRIASRSIKFLWRLARIGTDPIRREELLTLDGVVHGQTGKTLLDKFLYTTVQAVGCAYDATNPNSQRLFGLRYQSFIHAIINDFQQMM